MALLAREREMKEEAHAARMNILLALRNKVCNEPSTSNENYVTFVDQDDLCNVIVTTNNDAMDEF